MKIMTLFSRSLLGQPSEQEAERTRSSVWFNRWFYSLRLSLLSVLTCVVGLGCGPEVRGNHEQAKVPTLVGVVDLKYGSNGLANSDDVELVDVRGLALDSALGAAVSDYRADKLFIFSPDGRLQATVGRAGSGPGDLRGPCCIAFGPNGNLWVAETGNRRYSAFALLGTQTSYVDAISMPSDPAGLLTRVIWDTEGRLIHIGSAGLRPSGAFALTRSRLDSNGLWTALDTIVSPPPEDLGALVVRSGARSGVAGTTVIRPPFTQSFLLSFGHDGDYVSAISRDYYVSAVKITGGVKWSARRTLSAVALSAAERRDATRRLTSILGRHPQLQGQLELPRTKPILRGLCEDLDRVTWVQLEVEDGAQNSADLYDSVGRRFASLKWPADIDLGMCARRGEYALGVREDSLGVQEIVRLRFAGIQKLEAGASF